MATQFTDVVGTEQGLACTALALMGGDPADLGPSESSLLSGCDKFSLAQSQIKEFRKAIRSGADPLGDLFTQIRAGKARRKDGAVYTPERIVNSMVRWVRSAANPRRIVDPGAGSGRFIIAAGRSFPRIPLVAVEKDPLAALVLRANLKVVGLDRRCRVIMDDYRRVELDDVQGVTAFVGNPPYVRHHDVGAVWKRWYSREMASLGVKASELAGLHLHFFLKTLLLSRPGDIGAFITSAEWLDVNYGSALRNLFLNQLGGLSVHVLAPTVEAFPGTATTAAITCFRAGVRGPLIKIRSVPDIKRLNGLSKGQNVPRERLAASSKWSTIIRPGPHTPAGWVELGDLCRVHRGQVTGNNNIWIAGQHAEGLPARFLVPSVTKARDLLQAGEILDDAAILRCVIDLPADLSGLSSDDQMRVQRFLDWARRQGANKSYIAQHRKAWWSVGLKEPAKILCTYMARRPPHFAINACAARHINIAHGLYPRDALDDETLRRIVAWLNTNVSRTRGRTYAGGLTKFEPREMERIPIPSLNNLPG